MYVIGIAGYVWLAKPGRMLSERLEWGRVTSCFARLFVNSDMAGGFATPCTSTATSAASRSLSVRAISEDMSTEVTG